MIETRTSAEENHPARWWRPLDDGRIECVLCPRRCKLREGQRAFCFVRQRVGDAMVLTTYGRSTGFCVDPIEKKPLNHFLPGTSVLSFGTAGCNLGCKFCQNWETSTSRQVDALCDGASPAGIARTARDLGCSSVAFTYNDPVIFAEYAIDVADACRAEGVKAVAVTAGFVTAEARADFFAPMDAANVDLKGFTDRFYRETCSSGLGGLRDVLDTLVFVKHETDVWLEVTTLLIPGLNDSDEELAAQCAWMRRELGPDVPLHFSAFHPDHKLRDRDWTPASTLARARRIGLDAGLHHVYTGNVHDPAGQSTYCPSCGTCVIERDGYELGAYRLDPRGACASCGTRIQGVFVEHPGRWGSRRMPVRLSR